MHNLQSMEMSEINIIRIIALAGFLRIYWPHPVLALSVWALFALFIIPIFYR